MQGASEIEHPSVLDEALRRCVACCRETIETYAAKADPDPEFAAPLLAVVAALELAIEARPPRRERALVAAEEITRDAAARLRRYGLDEQILRCAAACDHAAHRLQAALRARP
jgi:hypothetical protein